MVCLHSDVAKAGNAVHSKLDDGSVRLRTSPGGIRLSDDPYEVATQAHRVLPPLVLGADWLRPLPGPEPPAELQWVDPSTG